MNNFSRIQELEIEETNVLSQPRKCSSVAERAVQRRRMMSDEERLKYNALAAERMQRMRERRRLSSEQRDMLGILFTAASNFLGPLLTAVRAMPSSLHPPNSSQATARIPLKLSDAPSSMLGMHVPGYELSRGNTTVKFLNYDGMFAGFIPECKEATAVIDTTGCSDLHRATMLAIKDGFLPHVNRLFFMRPTEG
jgi:hypothetical protein